MHRHFSPMGEFHNDTDIKMVSFSPIVSRLTFDVHDYFLLGVKLIQNELLLSRIKPFVRDTWYHDLNCEGHV